MKPAPALPAPEGTTFEKFARLFRTVVSLPKSAIEKEEAKERLKNRMKRTYESREETESRMTYLSFRARRRTGERSFSKSLCLESIM